MTRSKVKVTVTSRSKLESRPFSKAISSAVYKGSWQLTTRAQYLNLIRGRIYDILHSFLGHVTLNLAQTSVLKSPPSVPNLFLTFFISVPCARLSWLYRQLSSARKYSVSYCVVSSSLFSIIGMHLCECYKCNYWWTIKNGYIQFASRIFYKLQSVKIYY